jgi:hypothetical protein
MSASLRGQNDDRTGGILGADVRDELRRARFTDDPVEDETCHLARAKSGEKVGDGIEGKRFVAGPLQVRADHVGEILVVV